MAFEPPTEYNSAIMVNKSFQIVSPTVAELTEANPILAYNSNLAQTAATTATTQANAAATSAQTAQQAAAQATEISDPEGWRTNTRAMISDLAASKVNIGTFQFGAAGGALQTTGNPMYGIVDRSYCMTLELDEDWNLNTASNPNLWLNIAADGVRASSLIYGGVWCQLTRGSDELNYLQIIYGDGTNTYVNAFGAKVNVETIFGGTNSTIPAGKYTLCICIHFGEGTSADPSKAYVYVNNVLKSTISGYSTTKKTNLAWIAGGKLGFFDIGNNRSVDSISFSRYVHFEGKASRFAIFNFDMSTAGAPYSVADYYNGRAIPVATQSSLNITWNATDVPIYSMMVSGITSIPVGSVGYMNSSATLAYGDDGSISWTASDASSGFPQALVYRFKKAAFGSGKLIVNIGALTSTLPSDTKFFVNYFNESGTASDSTRQKIGTSGGSFEFDYKDGCMGMSIQVGTDTTWAIGNSLKVASVSAVVDGCIVASADYAIARNSTTRLVKDISGNGNDLTVYGNVIGDKDAAVAAFVDELKTQISQNS